MMNELAQKNRSYRRFDESSPVTMAQLREWTANARLSASAMNAQPLRYILVADPSTNRKIFPLLKWAGYLGDWDGPEAGERPTAYVVFLHDTEVKVKPEFVWCDMGLACQNMLLSASEGGYGGCMVASVNWIELRDKLSIDSRYEPLLVVALGAPVEDARIVDLPADGSIKYYRDDAGTHYVPKRSMDELILARR
ncbi:MAG: nitroreductase [Spirochaetes bacterium]|jgi:nitroreductase|nr:nitroreductase [Spirochaetota bacterium]